MATIWRRLTGPLNEFGIGAGLLYIVGRLLNAVSPRLNLYVYEMMAQPIVAGALLPERHTRPLSFRELGPDSPEIERMPARADIKASRFAQGARCLGTYRRDELIGYVWMCFGRYEEDEVRCTFVLPDAEHSAFDFDLYILPEHRMGTAFMAVWHGFNAYLRERGISHSYSRMTRFNLASRRAHARLGARIVGRAVFLQAWRCELMLATTSPYVDCSLRPASRMTLRLAADDVSSRA